MYTYNGSGFENDDASRFKKYLFQFSSKEFENWCRPIGKVNLSSV